MVKNHFCCFTLLQINYFIKYNQNNTAISIAIEVSDSISSQTLAVLRPAVSPGHGGGVGEARVSALNFIQRE